MQVLSRWLGRVVPVEIRDKIGTSSLKCSCLFVLVKPVQRLYNSHCTALVGVACNTNLSVDGRKFDKT